MSDEAVLAVIDALNELAIGYMLVGSFSSNFYGIPRSTEGADFVVEFRESSVAELARRLPPQLKLDPQSSFEMITATKRHVLRCVGLPFVVELFLLSADPHDQARFARRRQEKLLGRSVFLPMAEDVVITKLRWGASGQRSKDLDDIANVIGVQRLNLDWDYIHYWCELHGTRPLLAAIVKSIDDRRQGGLENPQI